MKITTEYLQKLIKEEVTKLLTEQARDLPGGIAGLYGDDERAMGILGLVDRTLGTEFAADPSSEVHQVLAAHAADLETLHRSSYEKMLNKILKMAVGQLRDLEFTAEREAKAREERGARRERQRSRPWVSEPSPERLADLAQWDTEEDDERWEYILEVDRNLARSIKRLIDYVMQHGSTEKEYVDRVYDDHVVPAAERKGPGPPGTRPQGDPGW